VEYCAEKELWLSLAFFLRLNFPSKKEQIEKILSINGSNEKITLLVASIVKKDKNKQRKLLSIVMSESDW
jgi:RecJ-like exonuclease